MTDIRDKYGMTQADYAHEALVNYWLDQKSYVRRQYEAARKECMMTSHDAPEWEERKSILITLRAMCEETEAQMRIALGCEAKAA